MAKRARGRQIVMSMDSTTDVDYTSDTEHDRGPTQCNPLSVSPVHSSRHLLMPSGTGQSAKLDNNRSPGQSPTTTLNMVLASPTESRLDASMELKNASLAESTLGKDRQPSNVISLPPRHFTAHEKQVVLQTLDYEVQDRMARLRAHTQWLHQSLQVRCELDLCLLSSALREMTVKEFCLHYKGSVHDYLHQEAARRLIDAGEMPLDGSAKKRKYATLHSEIAFPPSNLANLDQSQSPVPNAPESLPPLPPTTAQLASDQDALKPPAQQSSHPGKNTGASAKATQGRAASRSRANSRATKPATRRLEAPNRSKAVSMRKVKGSSSSRTTQSNQLPKGSRPTKRVHREPSDTSLESQATAASRPNDKENKLTHELPPLPSTTALSIAQSRPKRTSAIGAKSRITQTINRFNKVAKSLSSSSSTSTPAITAKPAVEAAAPKPLLRKKLSGHRAADRAALARLTNPSAKSSSAAGKIPKSSGAKTSCPPSRAYSSRRSSQRNPL
ncbi:hypothetical protein H4R34_005250 [Dimargaris verticillata]|uniref:Borealin N-terminal domain-containing protein n=1 Tax=Dimargaris verticillata TaxID=2761393 RepID=A0A9W8EBF1_9FUNG|nr:hypothetical protein H4R34_005250 [Dimargaris verticillata]